MLNFGAKVDMVYQNGALAVHPNPSKAQWKGPGT